MRAVRRFIGQHVSILAGGSLLAAVASQEAGCASVPSDTNGSSGSSGAVGPSEKTGEGTVGMKLALPGGVTLNAATWTITGPNGYSQTNTVNVAQSLDLGFSVGGIPAGSGYTISITGTATNGTTTCSGSAPFTVTALTTTNVTVVLQCANPATEAGSANVGTQTYFCATPTSVSASPNETTLGSSVTVTAAATAPNAGALAYQWSAPSGTFSAPTSATTSFTCTTSGSVTLTATVSDGTVPDGGSCANDTTTVTVQCDQIPGTPTTCSLGANGAIKHMIYVQFDNTHLYQDVYGRPATLQNVPSDLEQMPHLLSFIRNNGTMMADDHTVLISHTAGGILSSLTGVYPDRTGQTVSNSYVRTSSAGAFTFPSSFQYWTDPAYSNTTIPNLVTPSGQNIPAPWVSYTRAGCNMGAVGIANMEIENNNDYATGDIAEIFGTSSTEYQEAVTAWNAPYPTAASTISATDFEGIAVHCASGSPTCASGEPDLLPGEPGGYTGFNGLFGAKQVNPILIGQDAGTRLPEGGVALTDLLGNPITDNYGQPGFPGFDGMTAAVSLAYVASMQEHGIPVTYAYISDAHDNHGLDGSGQTAYGPGDPGYVAQLQAYDTAFENFFNRLAADGINQTNTLFVFTVDEGDHFVGGNPTPTNCDGVTTPCTWASGQIGEVNVNIDTLMNSEFPTVASGFAGQNGSNPSAHDAFTVHGDDAPTFYLSRTVASDAGATGALSQTDPATRAFERSVAQATITNPYTGNTDSLLYRMADQAGMAAVHMITTGDPARNPTFVYFADDDYFITDYPSSTPADAIENSYAWNHGDDQTVIGSTWQGWVGPGVQNLPDQTTVWTDHTDLRPTINSILGLTDDYTTDGRVLTEILSSSDYNSALSGNLGTIEQLGQAYKSITSPFDTFGQCVISASTYALPAGAGDPNDSVYTSTEAAIVSMTATQQSLISQIKSALWSAEFGGTAISTAQAQTWITEAQNLVAQCNALLATETPDGGATSDAGAGVDATVGADAGSSADATTGGGSEGGTSSDAAGAAETGSGSDAGSLATNVAVYRVGDGTVALANTGNPVFVDEYTQAGTLVQSFEMPTAVNGNNHRLIASGTATSEGLITLSGNGQYLILTGYDATPGGSSSIVSGSALRVVGRMDAFGNIDTTTAPTNFANANNPRGAASPDGTNIWMSGAAGGLLYGTLGTAGAATVVASTSGVGADGGLVSLVNLRASEIFGGQLYVSTSSGSAVRIGTVGTGLPQTTGQTMTDLPGFESSTGSPYEFYLTTLNGGTGPDTLYVSDSAAGIQKFSLVGGTWTANGAVGTASNQFTGITGVTSGSTVTLFATCSLSTGLGGDLVSVVDTSGYNEPNNGTVNTLATAGTNMAYRGVALFP
jgi:hypothetical protein